MKTSELRIGNLVYLADSDKIPFVIAEISQVDVKAFPQNTPLHKIIKYSIFSIRDIEPIILTEEILLKFGFEKKLRNYELQNLRFHLNKPIDYDGFLFCEGSIAITDKIQHVHQLQNLYFALTGEELIFND
jgi:hypothetical protein